ncbi:MAG TPA: glycosyltransferase [Solirubrobacteraceae bacterium]
MTAHTPVLRAGHSIRTYGVARALADRSDGLDLLYVGFDAPEPDAAFRAIPGIRLHEAVPSRGLRRMLAYGAARISGVPTGFARGVSAELAAEAEALADIPDRGRVIADGPIVAATLATLARNRPVIYNAHNVESGFRHEIEAGKLGRPRMHARAMCRFERKLLERAAESWMVSAADVAAAAELCPTARLREVPNVVDVAAIEPVRLVAPEPRAIFVASFFYEPNRTALRFLVDHVFPRVWAELPDARLTLVGPGLDQPPSSDPRIEALGFVDDLAEAYERARCAVVPLLQGGGTPLKFVEALAYGLPVIATPRAAAGLEVRDGEDCLIAEGDRAFAAALVDVLRDGAPQLGRQGRQLALDRYSIEALSGLVAN